MVYCITAKEVIKIQKAVHLIVIISCDKGTGFAIRAKPIRQGLLILPVCFYPIRLKLLNEWYWNKQHPQNSKIYSLRVVAYYWFWIECPPLDKLITGENKTAWSETHCFNVTAALAFSGLLFSIKPLGKKCHVSPSGCGHTDPVQLYEHRAQWLNTSWSLFLNHNV